MKPIKTTSTLKSIKSLVEISSKCKKDRRLMDVNGKYISDPTKIANLFNKFFANTRLSKQKYRDYLQNILKETHLRTQHFAGRKEIY